MKCLPSDHSPNYLLKTSSSVLLGGISGVIYFHGGERTGRLVTVDKRNMMSSIRFQVSHFRCDKFPRFGFSSSTFYDMTACIEILPSISRRVFILLSVTNEEAVLKLLRKYHDPSGTYPDGTSPDSIKVRSFILIVLITAKNINEVTSPIKIKIVCGNGTPICE